MKYSIPKDPEKLAKELADAEKQVERLEAMEKPNKALIDWWKGCVSAYEAALPKGEAINITVKVDGDLAKNVTAEATETE